MKPQLTVPACVRTLACTAGLLGGLASTGLAQSPKVSTSGTYEATFTCSGYDQQSGLLQVWDAANQGFPYIQMSCAGVYQVGAGAARMHYVIDVHDSTGVALKHCENASTSAIKQGRYTCKAGKISVTLAIEPK